MLLLFIKRVQVNSFFLKLCKSNFSKFCILRTKLLKINYMVFKLIPESLIIHIIFSIQLFLMIFRKVSLSVFLNQAYFSKIICI